MHPQVRVLIEDNSQVGEARRTVSKICAAYDLTEEDCSRASIVVTELATNVLKHATSGELLINGLEHEIHILCLDSGPGIQNLGKSLSDGYSTAGTPGNGLGAISRQSDSFDVFSAPKQGTVVAVTIGKNRTSARRAWGAVLQACPGETECGDNWSLALSANAASFIVADGLGHGPFASRASQDAVQVFDDSPFLDPSQILSNAHERLKGGRGAAVACTSINLSEKTLLHSGVGNISGHLVEAESSRGLLGHNGIVGVQAPKFAQTEHSWGGQTLLILHSDGISGRWSLGAYPGLFARSPSVISGVLYRDFYRHRDDVAILVVRLSNLAPAGTSPSKRL